MVRIFLSILLVWLATEAMISWRKNREREQVGCQRRPRRCARRSSAFLLLQLHQKKDSSTLVSIPSMACNLRSVSLPSCSSNLSDEIRVKEQVQSSSDVLVLDLCNAMQESSELKMTDNCSSQDLVLHTLGEEGARYLKKRYIIMNSDDQGILKRVTRLLTRGRETTVSLLEQKLQLLSKQIAMTSNCMQGEATVCALELDIVDLESGRESAQEIDPKQVFLFCILSVSRYPSLHLCDWSPPFKGFANHSNKFQCAEKLKRIFLLLMMSISSSTDAWAIIDVLIISLGVFPIWRYIVFCANFRAYS